MSRSPWNRFTSSSKDRDPHFGHFMVCGNEVLESAQAEGALAEWLVAADASRHPGLSLALQIASGALGKLADKREIAYRHARSPISRSLQKRLAALSGGHYSHRWRVMWAHPRLKVRSMSAS
jgi:hypothetical protein